MNCHRVQSMSVVRCCSTSAARRVNCDYLRITADVTWPTEVCHSGDGRLRRQLPLGKVGLIVSIATLSGLSWCPSAAAWICERVAYATHDNTLLYKSPARRFASIHWRHRLSRKPRLFSPNIVDSCLCYLHCTRGGGAARSVRGVPEYNIASRRMAFMSACGFLLPFQSSFFLIREREAVGAKIQVDCLRLNWKVLDLTVSMNLGWLNMSL